MPIVWANSVSTFQSGVVVCRMGDARVSVGQSYVINRFNQLVFYYAPLLPFTITIQSSGPIYISINSVLCFGL